MKHWHPIPLALVTMLALVGCPKAVQYENAAEAPGQAASEAQGEGLSLAPGDRLSGDRRALAEALTRAAWVQTQAAAGEWQQAEKDLNALSAEIKALQQSTTLPAGVRDQLAALPPTINALDRLIRANQPTALPIASGMVAQMQRVLLLPDTIAWMSSSEGGGGGAAQPAGGAAGPVVLAYGTGLLGDERAFADAYARSTWVMVQLAAGNQERATTELAALVADLKALQANQSVPDRVRALLATLQPTLDALTQQIQQPNVTTVMQASRLVSSMNAITTDPAVVAWLE